MHMTYVPFSARTSRVVVVALDRSIWEKKDLERILCANPVNITPSNN